MYTEVSKLEGRFEKCKPLKKSLQIRDAVTEYVQHTLGPGQVGASEYIKSAFVTDQMLVTKQIPGALQ